MTTETLRWYGLNIPVLRDADDQVICVGSRVRFVVDDETGDNDSYLATGDVLHVDQDGGQVFVSEPGNAGAEGWVRASSVFLVNERNAR